MANIPPLTSAEKQLMKLIWTLKSFRSKDLLAIHPEPVPHPNTVSTFLKILHNKGFIRAKKVGRIYEYRAKISKDDYINHTLTVLISDFFNGENAQFIQFLQQKNIFESDENKNTVKETHESPLPPPEKKNKKKKKKNKKKKKKEKSKPSSLPTEEKNLLQDFEQNEA